MLLMPMNILLISVPMLTSSYRSFFFSNLSSNSLSYWPSFKISCSTQKPPRNGDNGDAKDNNGGSNSNNGDQFSIDWNKAWSSFKKQAGKKRKTQFNPDKYVTWNPRPSNYPLSEEVDPIKRTEKSNLMLWTSPTFTLFGAIVVVSLLLIYTLVAPLKLSIPAISLTGLADSKLIMVDVGLGR
ncbi:hypothetical protein Cgig2_008533 [Carnegiea gigantea]|uniref:Transmembrane protein n=1 Tax=Carnegiea gigantea TaxID=171969 RepID=A0A9Q1JSC5_9CARY|nr:hypothetical protein Cgig2_008533 [Carnegiea gigantea]